MLAYLLGLLGLLACSPGLFGPFVALAVRGPGVPDRGEMEEEEKEQEEEKKMADLKLKYDNPSLYKQISICNVFNIFLDAGTCSDR